MAQMSLLLFRAVILAAFALFAGATPSKRAPANEQYVSTSGGGFSVNGSEFRFIGTTAYWLTSLHTEEDVDRTFASMRAKGIRVVRTWAFNDVEAIPESGDWIQLVANGTTTLNTGPNGVRKLDIVIRQAEKHGIYLMLTLTNNWNPRPLLNDLTNRINGLTATVDSDEEGDNLISSLTPRDSTFGTNNTLPRNTLSNDFGGMDVYVRQFGLKSHDEFFTNEAIVKAFHNYTTQVVTRYANSSSVFSWELANDPRCHSTLKASSSCNPQVVTKWMDQLSKHVRSIDTNHLIASGAQGFLCTGCTKIMPIPSLPLTETPAVVDSTQLPSFTVSEVPSSSLLSSSLIFTTSSLPSPSLTFTTTLPPHTETVTLPGTTRTITETLADASLTSTETPATRLITVTLPETTNIVTATLPNTTRTLTEGPVTRVVTLTLPTTTTTLTETPNETDVTVTETPDTFTEILTPTTTVFETLPPPTVTETPPVYTEIVIPTSTITTTLPFTNITVTETPADETVFTTIPPRLFTTTLPHIDVTITETPADETLTFTANPETVLTTLPPAEVTETVIPVDSTETVTAGPNTIFTTLPQDIITEPITPEPVTRTEILSPEIVTVIHEPVVTWTTVTSTIFRGNSTNHDVTITVTAPAPTEPPNNAHLGSPVAPGASATHGLGKRQYSGAQPGPGIVTLSATPRTVTVSQTTRLVTVTLPRATTIVTITLPEATETVTVGPATRSTTYTLSGGTDLVTQTIPDSTVTLTETPSTSLATVTLPQVTNIVTETLPHTNETVTGPPVTYTETFGPTGTIHVTLPQVNTTITDLPTTETVTITPTILITTTLPPNTIEMTVTPEDQTAIVTPPPDITTTTLLPTTGITVTETPENVTLTIVPPPTTLTTTLPDNTVTTTVVADDVTLTLTPEASTVFTTLPPSEVTLTTTPSPTTENVFPTVTSTTTVTRTWVLGTATQPGTTYITYVPPTTVYETTTYETTVYETTIVPHRAAPTSSSKALKKRQQEAAAFDGSQGIDSEDIINCPEISFATFQLFPDQNDYGLEIDPTLSAFNNTVNGGIEWIRKHAEMAAVFGKPAFLTGFGLVTQTNSPFFVPFNGTIAPFGPGQLAPGGEPYGITEAQLGFAYERWLDTGIDAGLAGLIHYQWSQRNITGVEGTSIGPVEVEENSPSLDVPSENGVTPNDGYAIQETGEVSVQSILEYAAQEVH